jgi:hypothetical protein
VCRNKFVKIPDRRPAAAAAVSLRQVAEIILHIVERKGVTTCQEVADELVADLTQSSAFDFPVS